MTYIRKTCEKTCQYCQQNFKTIYKRNKFCNQSCAAKFNNQFRVTSESQKQKTSQSLKIHYINNPKKKITHIQALKCGIKSSSGKYKKNVKSIFELSSSSESRLDRKYIKSKMFYQQILKEENE